MLRAKGATVVGFLLTAIPIYSFAGQVLVNGPEPELIYDALDVKEFSLIFRDPETLEPREGITVFEKEVGGLLCRRSAPVVPNPEFTYRCYVEKALSNQEAKILFYLLRTKTERVSYIDPVTGFPRLGVIVLERSRNGWICQSVAAVVPNPVPRYTCYRDIE